MRGQRGSGVGDLLEEVVREGHFYAERDGVEALEAEDEFVDEQSRLLVKGAHEGVALVKAQQHVHVPFELGKP